MTVPDPSKTAFVFPGQGSQKVGRGKELAAAYPEARAVFDEADKLLGFPLSKLCWEGPDAELNETVNTQPALLVHSVAALRVFHKLQPAFQPAYVAGHSLGEISAAVAAGALDYEAGVKLVRRRGELMMLAGKQNPGGMAAILGLDIPTLDTICVETSEMGQGVVQVANDNCPGQVVISGHSVALTLACESAKAMGAKRILPLAVSIAAHSPLMATVQEEWDNEFANTKWNKNLQAPLVGNVTAMPSKSIGDLKADLQAQLTNRVRWTESIRALRKLGVTTFIELGSGSVLTGLLKRIDAEAEGMPLGEPGDFEKLK